MLIRIPVLYSRNSFQGQLGQGCLSDLVNVAVIKWGKWLLCRSIMYLPPCWGDVAWVVTGARRGQQGRHPLTRSSFLLCINIQDGQEQWQDRMLLAVIQCSSLSRIPFNCHLPATHTLINTYDDSFCGSTVSYCIYCLALEFYDMHVSP